MANPNTPSNLSEHEYTVVTTVGEINNWLNHEAIGGTAPVAAYLDALQSMIDKKFTDSEELRYNALMLMGEIGRHTEDRLRAAAKENGGAVVEIEGISPLKVVTKEDIFETAHEFDPTREDAENYVDSLDLSLLHATIMDVIGHEFPDLKPEEW